MSDSFCRAITFNFGTICFASLTVPLVQSIREMFDTVRDHGDCFSACIADAILDCIESIVELFNQYALIYAAIHGTDFLTAGRTVMDIFKERGWKIIVTDMITDIILFMVAVGVALLVGILTVIIGQQLEMQQMGTLGGAFGAGLLLGYSMCAVLFSVVSSAVNTVIVCYAEAPNEFEANHPVLSEYMRDAWNRAWPVQYSDSE